MCVCDEIGQQKELRSIQCHDIPLGGSGSSVTAAIPLPLGSTFSQSDSGVIPIPIPFRCLNGS